VWFGKNRINGVSRYVTISSILGDDIKYLWGFLRLISLSLCTWMLKASVLYFHLDTFSNMVWSSKIFNYDRIVCFFCCIEQVELHNQYFDVNPIYQWMNPIQSFMNHYIVIMVITVWLSILYQPMSRLPWINSIYLMFRLHILQRLSIDNCKKTRGDEEFILLNNIDFFF